MLASKRFDRYKDEHLSSIRQSVISGDEGMVKVLSVLFQSVAGTVTAKNLFERKERIMGLESIKELDYSPEDVERLSIALLRHEESIGGPENLGFLVSAFLNALIINGKDESYTVHADGYLNMRLLGYKNTSKTITVHGELHGDIGEEMAGGRIFATGDVHGYIGSSMSGGEIVVHGDSLQGTGISQKGGSIEIRGNASGQVGLYMNDGEIVVRGDAEANVGLQMHGGKITVEGDTITEDITILDGTLVFKGNVKGEHIGDHNTFGGRISVKGDVEGMIGKSQTEGEIVIHGDVKGDVGPGLRGARITVKGSVDGVVGAFKSSNGNNYAPMDSGEVHIGGEIKELEEINGGKIYQRGKLIVDK
jgi:formylmethanofuran dehydrogenase subunit C